MIDFLIKTIVPQFIDLPVTAHSGDTYKGIVNQSTLSPFHGAWYDMIKKGKFWIRTGAGKFVKVEQQSTLSGCTSTVESYFFDGVYTPSGGDLYIHVSAGATVSSYIVCADGRGFSLNEAHTVEGIVYDPRVVKTVPLKIKAD